MSEGVEPWRECAEWLTRCGVLREDHIANGAHAKAGDLALTLRDGVILCNLLNIIDPGSIDSKDVNQKPRLAQACHDVFKLKESDLFEPEGLYDLTDFLRVLQTLSKLSTSPKFKNKNIRGFASIKPRTSQEDPYKDLSSSNGFKEWKTLALGYPTHYDRSEEIYENLCYVSYPLPTQV